MSQESEAQRNLTLARTHLNRVQISWDAPTDWGDLATYGLWCLEAAVVAATEFVGSPTQRQHWAKADASRDLAANHDLPDIADLLRDLNEMRKAVGYGDTPPPQGLSAEDTAAMIEQHVDAVAALLGE